MRKEYQPPKSIVDRRAFCAAAGLTALVIHVGQKIPVAHVLEGVPKFVEQGRLRVGRRVVHR